MGSVCVRSVMGSVTVMAPVLLASVLLASVLLASVVLTPVPVASVVLASKVVVGSVPLPTAARPSWAILSASTLPGPISPRWVIRTVTSLKVLANVKIATVSNYNKTEPFCCWVFIYIKSNYPIKWKSMGSPVHNNTGFSVSAVPVTVSGIPVGGVTLSRINIIADVRQ